MKTQIVREKPIDVLELSPEEMIDKGYHLMTHAQEYTNCKDAVREAREIRDNMENVEEVRISQYEGFYDVYVRLNKQGEVA